MTKSFEVGRTYSTRSLCDWDCIYSFDISARTPQTVKVAVHGKTKTCKITMRDGVESIKPYGSYSMACVLYATDTADKIEAEEARAAELSAKRAAEREARR